MARTRKVLNLLCVEFAGAKRRCHHDKQHTISKGEACLVIKDQTYGGKQNYCASCALAILDLAADDVQTLRDALN